MGKFTSKLKQFLSLAGEYGVYGHLDGIFPPEYYSYILSLNNPDEDEGKDDKKSDNNSTYTH